MARCFPTSTVVTTPLPASRPERFTPILRGGHDMIIAGHKTLLEFLMDLLNDKQALADFRHDPHAALEHAGLGNVCVDDIKELLPVVLEKHDAEQCAHYEDACDEDKCWDEKPHHKDGDDGSHCKPIECDDDGRPAPHCSEIDKVVTHLNYVTNHYSYDSHDTIITNNNITTIWADHGSHVNVSNENVSAGAGGVAAGHDINAPVATGGHNVIGNGNQVSGEGSTTAFGAGSALSHVGTGDGGALSINGPATATNAFGHGNQVAAPGGTNTNAPIDSHNTDNSHHSTLTNSQNHTTDNSDHSSVVDTSHSGNTDASLHDSGNTALDTSIHDNHVDLAVPHL